MTFQKDRVELRLAPGLPKDIPGRLSEALLALTGRRWLIALSQSPGAATLAEAEATNRAQLLAAVAEEAAVREVLDAFPGATIVDIRDARRGAPERLVPPVTAAVPPELDDWPPSSLDDDDLAGHMSIDVDDDTDNDDGNGDDSRMER